MSDAPTPWTSFGKNVRVEPGPALVKAKADDKTLSNDVTAPHYQVGQRDAFGKEISAGEDFHYLDYLAHARGESAWYVYELQNEEVRDAGGNVMRDDDGKVLTQDRWVEVAAYPNKDAAHDAASRLQEGG